MSAVEPHGHPTPKLKPQTNGSWTFPRDKSFGLVWCTPPSLLYPPGGGVSVKKSNRFNNLRTFLALLSMLTTASPRRHLAEPVGACSSGFEDHPFRDLLPHPNLNCVAAV